MIRSLHHKIANKSWLTISYIFPRLFWILFLLSSCFAIGLITGLYKNTAYTQKDDIKASLILKIFIVISFTLWLVFMATHRKQRRKEEIHEQLEYLEELRTGNALSQEDFLMEKEKILNKY